MTIQLSMNLCACFEHTKIANRKTLRMFLKYWINILIFNELYGNLTVYNCVN